MLGKAKGLGADVSAHLKYLDTLKQAAKEYTEAEAKGKALETAERSEVRVQSSGTARTATTETTKAPSTPTQSSALSPQSYDDVYVATAATGEKIPHPLSRKTNTIIVGNQRIKVPEGMVFVAAGPFIMGDDNDPLASPAHKVDVPAFFIGKYEVTNAEYMEFVKASGRSMPEHFVKNGNLIPKGRENHPVTYVSWEDAKAYCDWSGKRLPAEAEWEKAASWDFKKKCKNVYPWGDNMDLDPGRPLANWTARWGYRKGDDPKKWWEGFHKSEKGRELIALGGATTSVGMFKGGMSPYKCYDMAGNVYEWVEDWFNKYPGNTMMSAKDEADCGEKRRVFRGGDWSHDYSPLRCVHRVCGLPGSRPFYVSFRCAADYPWRPTEKVEGEKERRGEGATGRGGETAKEKEESAKSAEKPSSAVPSSPAPRPSSQSFDDVYVTAAATGDKIPHPLSKKTYNLQYMGRTIKVPEGMVYVPAGPFIMGEGTSEHRVYLDAYFIGKYEVTNAEWKAFIEATAFTPLPSHWKGGQIPEGRENHPVVCISWVDAEKYCEWVSKETGREIRLPTEAQWEKAASWDPRKNGKLKYPWGDQWDNKFCNSKWLTMAKCGIYLNDEQDQVQRYIALTKTQKYAEVAKAEGGFDTAAGAFARDRSPYGCYDMAGNVMELCADWYKADYYVKSAKRNPQGPNEEEGDDVSLPVYNNYKGKARVWRGGEWDNDSGVPASRDCRTTKRGYYAQTYRDSRWSFRIVCIPEKK
jgi:formylglycine-generating enzyme required for sulfatase activity